MPNVTSNPEQGDLEIFRELLKSAKVLSFSATSNDASPLVPQVTLTWSCVDAPGVIYQINRRKVPPAGSEIQQPLRPTSYLLSAKAGPLSKNLRSLTIGYDTSMCISVEVPEALIKQVLLDRIDESVSSQDSLSLRKAPVVDVMPSGIACSIRLLRVINNFPDLKVNVDCIFTLTVRDGVPIVTIAKFSVDTDFAGWVAFVTVGASKIVEEVVDGYVEKVLKAAIVAGIESAISKSLQSFPSTFFLNSIALDRDSIHLLVCPRSL